MSEQLVQYNNRTLYSILLEVVTSVFCYCKHLQTIEEDTKNPLLLIVYMDT